MVPQYISLGLAHDWRGELLGSLVSNVAYNTAVRIFAICSILAMAIQNNLEAQYANDAWYAATIAVIVIGPHALERLAGSDSSSTTQHSARILAPIVPFLGLFLALTRFAF